MLTLSGSLAATACNGQVERPEALVEPVSAPQDGVASSGSAGSSPTTPPTEGSALAAPPPLSSTTPSPSSDERTAALRASVDEVLTRYDRALTALAATPVALVPSPQPHPLVLAWDAVVQPGSLLSSDVLARVASSAGSSHVRPAGDGFSYRHLALEVQAVGASAVTFTWCGASAGVRVADVDGAVIDDGVGHSHGVGELRDEGDGAGWRLASLDQMDLVVLPPGSADPCPAEQRTAGGVG